jgi:hypothetical protein
MELVGYMFSRVVSIFMNSVVEIISMAIPRVFANTYTHQSCRPFMSQNSINFDAWSLDLFMPPVAIYGDAQIHMLTSVGYHLVPLMNKIQYMTMPGVCTYIFKSSHRIPNNLFLCIQVVTSRCLNIIFLKFITMPRTIFSYYNTLD